MVQPDLRWRSDVRPSMSTRLGLGRMLHWDTRGSVAGTLQHRTKIFLAQVFKRLDMSKIRRRSKRFYLLCRPCSNQRRSSQVCSSPMELKRDPQSLGIHWGCPSLARLMQTVETAIAEAQAVEALL